MNYSNDELVVIAAGVREFMLTGNQTSLAPFGIDLTRLMPERFKQLKELLKQGGAWHDTDEN
ncbi:MAG TPA: hypothetical protein VIM11_07360 [Tepidisphaeraceae bacterium]